MDVLNLIDGRWCGADSGYSQVEPSTGTVLLEAPESSGSEVDAAVAAATKAADAWAARPAPDRGDVLHRAAAHVERNSAVLAAEMAEEVGKPIREAAAEVGRTAAILRFYAGEGRRLGGAVLPSDGTGLTLTLRAPVGVTALVTPWNFPLAIPAWKLGPALVAGNPVVLKPAPQAARSATRLAGLLLEAGLPAGVLNVVCGRAAGPALVAHDDVAAVSCTGSTATGGAVRQAAAARGVRAQVEMGGKNVALVLADADLDAAAAAVAAGAFGFAGQKCTATGLCLVESDVADEFGRRLEEARAALVVGDPREPQTDCGPLIDAAGRERAVGYGAKARRGSGFYAEPTILTGVDPRDDVCRDEVFGPVLPVVAVDSLESAIRTANRLPTGLASAVHTSSASSAVAFMRHVVAGVLAVNRPTTGLEVQAPFGGLKASGSEHREQGSQAIDFYTVLKTVYWNP